MQPERVRDIARRLAIAKWTSGRSLTPEDIEAGIRKACNELIQKIENACLRVQGRRENEARDQDPVRVRIAGEVMAAIREVYPEAIGHSDGSAGHCASRDVHTVRSLSGGPKTVRTPSRRQKLSANIRKRKVR